MRLRRPGLSRTSRPGISLLEVLAALAIFMFSVIVISQMVDTAARTAQRAQRLSRAALLAESAMNELAAGARPMSPVGSEQIVDGDSGWTVSIDVQTEQWSSIEVNGQFINGLNSVQVTVTWNNGLAEPVQYTLCA